uniref:Aspartyl aminopeptidase n=1 Tax=Schistocephalus solidus TaxID=70667 RepID=A0A0X3PEH2_SCHSO
MASMDPVPNCSASIPSRGTHSHDRENLTTLSTVAMSPVSAKVELPTPETSQSSFQNCIFGGLQQSQPVQPQPMEEVEVPPATSPSRIEPKMDVIPAPGTPIEDSGDLSAVPFQPFDSKSARSSPPLSASTSATASSSPAKRPRHKPGERRELLLLAVNDVLSQSISMRKAAQRYNLAKSSLCDFVRKNNIQLPNNRYKTISSNSATPAKAPPSMDSVSPQTVDTPTEVACDAATTTAVDYCPSDALPDRNGSPSPQNTGSLKLPLSQAAVAAARSLLNGLSIKTTLGAAVNDSLSALSTAAATSANTGTVEARPETRCSRPSLGAGLSLNDPRLFSSTPPTTTSSSGSGNLAACPRMESPWHNVSGLPTQVPIGNWGVWPVMNPKNTKLAHFASNGSSNTTTTTASLCKVPVSLTLESLRSSPVAAACTVSDDTVMQLAGRFSDSGENSYTAGRTAAVTAPGFVSSVVAAPSAADYLAASARSGLTSDLFPATGISLPPSVAAFGALLSASQPPPPTPTNPLVGDLTSVAIARSLLQSSPGANPTGLPFPLQTPALGEQQQQQTSSPTSAAAAAAAAEAVLKGFSLPAEQQHQPTPDFAAAAVTAATAGTSNSDGGERTNISAADYLKIAALVSQLPDLLEAAQSPTSLIYQIQQKLLSGVFSANSPIVVGRGPQALAAKCQVAPSNQQATAKHTPRNLMAQARELISFINKSPSPFHVVRSVRDILAGHGFQELHEDQVWKLRPNDYFYVTKNRSSIFAVAVGGAYKPGNGFSIIGAHTDSPCLRLKPISERVKEGFVQLAVETYGGGLWYSWFDRDLTVAGRCLVRLPSGALEERLVHVNRPIACVPSLAIHLNRDANKAFSPNPEQHLAPILCTTLTEQVCKLANASELAVGVADMESEKPHSAMDAAASCPSVPSGSHPLALLKLIAEELNCAESDLVELELYFADTQPACLGGVHSEFIHAPRLDNQFNAFAGIQGLVNSLPSLKEDSNVRIVCLYDHEEIGSRSAQGANSVYTAALFRRLTSALAASFEGNESAEKYCLFEQTMAKSFLLSADQAHAVHPSWPERYEPAHKPAFHGGIVLKYNCSQNYATSGLTAAVVREVARRSAVPLQEFVIRQDQPCGGTIGPILSTQLGVPTADVGGAQLAMHSCREMTCTTSVSHAIALFTGYFEQLPNILQTMSFK